MKNILPVLLLLFSIMGFAQQQPNALALKIREQKTQKSDFKKPSLFQFAGQSKAANQFDDYVSNGQLLKLDLTQLKSVYQSAPATMEMELPNGGEAAIILELVKTKLLTDDFTLVTSISNGQPVDYQPGVYYRGIVKGDENSLAAISIFEDEIIGVVSTKKAGNMVLGRTDGTAKSANYIFYKDEDLLLDHSFECGSEETPVAEGKESAENTGGEKVEKCVRAYLEADYDLVSEKGGATAAANFVTGLFNVVAGIYQNEAITVNISQIFTWTTADPYATSSTSAALTSFRSYRTTYNGDVASLISRGAPTGGGIAWVGALCTSYAYSYCYIYSSYNQFPTYSWSVNVIAHEMGHNLGSPHTHACAWNGNNTAIDGCGPAVGANEGCSGPIPSAGTMMSYCHLVNGVGINFNLGFGPQPGDKIRSKITAANCLTTCASACLTVSTNGTNLSCASGNNGTATATATGSNGPFTYAWSNGGNTQTISNLAAGTYTVTVSAGSNCTGTATRIVTAPSAISTSASVTNTTNGQNNGAINLSVSGGTPGYAYLWSNGATTQDLANIAAGTYTVTVTDANGCTATRSATVGTSNSNPITLSFAVTNANSGQNDGAINLTVSGGTAPFSYLWSNGATTQDLVNIAAGTYTVTVTCPTGTKTGSATVGTNAPNGCTSVNLPDAESFEGNLGNWSQATNDQMDWTIGSGTTPTNNTGPNGASNGTYYVYTEATGYTNKIAFLLSPCYNIAGINTFQVVFNYNMYGSQMGNLYFQFSMNNGSTWSTIWTKKKNQGTGWKSLTMNFTNNGASSIRFRFYGKTGNDRSDMAVDNFSIVQTGNLTNGETADASIVLDPLVEVSENGTLQLSPNPVADELSLTFYSEQNQSGKITISDQMGHTLKTEQVEVLEGNNHLNFDVANLPVGLYFLTVEDGQNQRVERFVVFH
ncbi:MAG: T9SS type A sorting domain-containing protein [Bacteroidetes bacterium]|nr:T9SS type A sorting domain-containing protein [Bacteroidota bacterium]